MDTYDVELGDDWTYGPGVLHGGWLVSTIGEVALRQVPHPHPIAVSAHFASAAAVGPGVVDVDVVRSGRSVSSVHARLRQGEKTRVDLLLTAGELTGDEPSWSRGDEPPVLKPVEECVRSRMPAGSPRNGIVEQLDIRYDRDAWSSRGTGRGEVSGWLRLASGAQVDALSLLTVCDGLPPITLDLDLPGWVPTIEYTVHVRALPAPGWLQGVQRGRLLQDGWLDEECEIWDSRGRLVAQARQLAGYRAS
jgi:hypothetical protein